jgi:hypothetical protein
LNIPALTHSGILALAAARSRGAIAVAVLLLLSFTSAPAVAGRYELVKGKGVEVCEAYKKNLNSFNYADPMNCTREIGPQQKDLSKPQWQTLDANENFALVQTVDRFLQPPNYERVTEGYLENLKQRVANGGVVMSLAEIDVNNDGKAEPVLRFNYGPCAPPGTKGWWGTPLLVLNDKHSAIDLEKSRAVLVNSSIDEKKDPAGAWTYAMYDVFTFKKKIYLDRWSDVQSATGFLHVFLAEKAQTKEVCTYKFHPDNR